ncbi:MAG: glutamate--tRNA ligase [Candidatus Omnitrophica bacterium]|nr:glutamate--tRNA ligase [Candidatus Omnitrophota bacterium]
MIRVRFAPSPTGYLHIGGARTCLFNWLYARNTGGKFILRIEDTDLERSKKEYLDEILESIKWLGMEWDEIYYQSQRFDLYHKYAEKLIEEGKAYRKEGAVFFKYDFETIEIDDLIRGKIVFKELPKQEEVIIKSDNSPAYNFCCVIDDALMRVNRVLRGEDHISNTPKQILMYKGLGFEVPQFAHLPLILSPQGGRLSKRFGATSIREHRQMGYLSEAIINYLMLLGWSPGEDKEIISLNEAKNIFNIKDVNKTGAAFSMDKLNWINGSYIRSMNMEDLSKISKDYLPDNYLPSWVSQDYYNKVISIFQERTVRLTDLAESMKFCFYDDFKYNEETQKILDNDLSDKINCLIEELNNVNNFIKEEIEEKFRKTAETLEVKMRVLVHPTRVALTGNKNGPGLFETIEILGKEKVLSRLRKLVEYWGGINE